MSSRRRKIHKSPQQIQPAVQGGTLTIERLAHGGRGVGYLDGLTVFVPRTAPGDVVEVRLTDWRRHYAFGEIIALKHPAPVRVTAPCPFYDDCGGCHLQHLSYTQQLNLKTVQIRDSLTRIGKLPDVPVAPTLGSPRPFGYRNKVLYHYDQQNRALGLVHRHGDGIIDLPECRISDPRANTVMHRLRTLATSQPILQQTLRHVQVQVGQRTGEVLVTVIVRAALPVQLQRQVWEALRDVAVGVWMHVNTQETPAVFHGISTLIAGQEAINERLGASTFRIEPETFVQVNTVQMARLYDVVRAYATLRGHEVVLDLYSGAGAVAFQLAPFCARVYAVEVNRQASLLAIQHAQRNGVENCQFRTGKVERILYRYMAQQLDVDLAVLDPPRAGCRPEALQALVAMRVPRIIYVSCSPPTLARDLRLLHDHGYRTIRVQPLDMFPQTYHIECVALVEYVGTTREQPG